MMRESAPLKPWPWTITEDLELRSIDLHFLLMKKNLYYKFINLFYRWGLLGFLTLMDLVCVLMMVVWLAILLPKWVFSSLLTDFLTLPFGLQGILNWYSVKIVQALRKEPLTVYGDGKQTRSFQYVSDLVIKAFVSFYICLYYACDFAYSVS